MSKDVKFVEDIFMFKSPSKDDDNISRHEIIDVENTNDHFLQFVE